MKIHVDARRCQAHGECLAIAPEIFDLGDDDDVVTVLDAEPGEELRGRAELAALACPEVAISIED